MAPKVRASSGNGRLRGRLVLEDGSCFEGFSFGADLSSCGEVVFNTGMVGYPEALTDPSYHGQILVFTYPSLGNYGVPGPNGKGVENPWFESSRVQPEGVICACYSEEYSHHEAVQSLGGWLTDSAIPALTGIDTRALTQRLRQHGTLLGRIEVDGTRPMRWTDPNRRNLVREVSRSEPQTFGNGRLEIGLLDCGAKNNLIRTLLRHDVRVTVLPWDANPSMGKEMAGVMLSNGPGNPRMVRRSVTFVRGLLRQGTPILGVCLGHQLLALAAGARTFKMKYGHRSQNQPCLEPASGRCYITSQNHGYAVEIGRLPDDWQEWFRNANDGTNEGIRHRRRPWRAVQFHPEAAPGPGGTEWIIEEFLGEIS